jgi:hypothetical protein
MSWYDPIFNPIIAFHAGVFVEGMLLLWGRVERADFRRFLWCLGAAPAYVQARSIRDSNPISQLGATLVMFCVFFAVVFKDKILASINKELLLIWNLIVVYLFFGYINWHAVPILTIALLAFSAVSIANAFLTVDRYAVWRGLLYVWFLVMIIGLAVSRLVLATTEALFYPGHNLASFSISAFFVGGAFVYLLVHVWYLVELAPVPRAQESLQERWAMVRRNLGVFSDAYHVEPLHRGSLIVATTIVGVLLLINFGTHIMPNGFLIPLTLAVGRFVASYKPVVMTPPIQSFVGTTT